MRDTAYGWPFWLASSSNLVVMSGVALLYRYADFITLLGGTEFHLGWIVGVGMIGSFAMRLALGSWINRYGARPLWIASLLLFAVTCFAHLAVASYAGVSIYLLRVSYCCAVAGINGASMTFVSARAPNERLAELIGMLGVAGFLGAVVGSLLGDVLLGSIAINSAHVITMFVAAGVLAHAGDSVCLGRHAGRATSLPSPFGRGAGGEGWQGFRVQGSEVRSQKLQISKSPNLQIVQPSP